MLLKNTLLRGTLILFLLLLTLAACRTSLATTDTVVQAWDARQQFDPFYNPTRLVGNTRWSYHSTPDAVSDGSLSLLETRQSPSGTYLWRHSAYNYPFIGKDYVSGAPDMITLHPGRWPSGWGSYPRNANVVWTAPQSGRYRIFGRLERLDIGTTEVAVYLNSTPLLGATVMSGGPVPFEYSRSLNAGDTIRFVVGPYGTQDYDSTGLKATIELRNAVPTVACDTRMVRVPKGSIATNTGTFQDPDGDPVTLATSVGTIQNIGGGRWNWSADTAAIPGPGRRVEITATDTVGNRTVSGFFLEMQAEASVHAWGSNVHGQTSVLAAAQSGVVQVAGGSTHSLGLKTDGTVIAWGTYYNGSQVPATPPFGLASIAQVAAGGPQSIALKTDGTVIAWGTYYNGSSWVPVAVPAGLSDVVQVAAGVHHSLALKADGTVVAWGGNGYGQTSVPAGLAGVVQVAAGGGHSLALKADGTVVAWGWNESGQASVAAAAQSNVVQIAAGLYHSLALKADGTVIGWGHNYWGQTSVPTGLAGVVQIATGEGRHSLALKAAGGGRGRYGQARADCEPCVRATVPLCAPPGRLSGTPGGGAGHAVAGSIPASLGVRARERCADQLSGLGR